MKEIEKNYAPEQVEEKWYQYWLAHDIFTSVPNENKKSFCIVIPPPNVTGVLHMGHMLNNTIQDILIRRARMQGYEACWVPGTDHASIATEAKVVQMLRERGIKKSDLSREEFLSHAWEWKEKYGGIILEQLKRLGASCDWNRTRFTMEPSLSQSVTRVFVQMYNKGYIYRGLRMVNWDPLGKTALSDEEVIYREQKSKLYYINYVLKDNNSTYLTVATTRPETILGDTAVCVHPYDERYKHLVGKSVLVPIIHREIPIIADEYVDMTFGSGCLKVTPAHDINDYELGKKHKLPLINIMNEDGTFNSHSLIYEGKDRFEVRKDIVKRLEQCGHLIKVEEINNSVGYSERTDAVVEPRLSMQWFVDMKKFISANPQVIEAVMNDEIQLVPAKFKNTYHHWLTNVKDWCISRQLWWGHRIPAYYAPSGDYAVAETFEQAYQQLKIKNPELMPEEVTQDEDVLDTWYSSWLWPISVFDGIIDPDNKDFKYYYPTDVLVTAPEILFFWVARMIMAGYEFAGEKPFKYVYLTGIVRDKLGRKMSKSLGNSPDPVELMQKYSTDGVRFGMLLSSPAGNDLLFDEKHCEQGRNFANKIWNAFRLICSWKSEITPNPPHAHTQAVQWFKIKLQTTLIQIEDLYSKFRLSEAQMLLYKLIWDDFCSWYLEIVKPPFEKNIDEYTYCQTKHFFDQLMRLLHPFMPFITEEIWQGLEQRTPGDTICKASYPQAEKFDENQSFILDDFEQLSGLIASIRNFRNSKQISPKTSLILQIHADRLSFYSNYSAILIKLGNLSAIEEKPVSQQNISFMVGKDEFYIPLNETINVEIERKNLMKEIEYLQGFLQSVEKKLSNEKFIANAPAEVVENERKKKSDALAKIESLTKSLEHLS